MFLVELLLHSVQLFAEVTHLLHYISHPVQAPTFSNFPATQLQVGGFSLSAAHYIH